MSELNALFEQILHSERNFKARINRLRELSSTIQQCQLEVQHVREEAHLLQGKRVVKSTKLADLEVKCKLLTFRRKILQDQRDKLTETRKELADEKGVVDKALEAQRQLLVDELLEFSQSYDLYGSGYKYREEQAERKTNVFQDELLLLEAELTEMDSQREEVAKLEEELGVAEAAVRKEREKEDDWNRTLLRQESEIKQLEEEKNMFGQKLSRDTEFVRLQKELETCKDCPEEVTCESLTKELEELQKQCYHKQMRQHLSLQNTSKKIQGGSNSFQRQTGHYNPYTHQYVPAPNAAKSQPRHTKAGSMQTTSMALGSSLQHSNRQDVDVDIDFEWSAEDEQEWGMELDENELESFECGLGMTDSDSNAEAEADFTAGCDLEDDDDFEDNQPSLRKDTLARGGSGRSIISGTATGPSSGIADSRRNRGYSNFTPSPLNGSTNMLHKQGQVFHRITQQATSTQSGIAASRVNSSRVRPAQATFTNRRAPPKSRVSEGNCESAHVSNRALTLSTNSPEPSYAVRRRPGQSIYKAPGQQQQQQNARLPKSAKKVRFHY